jgi:hypothetical protein
MNNKIYNFFVVMVGVVLTITISTSVVAEKLSAKVISIKLPNGNFRKISDAPKNNQYDRSALEGNRRVLGGNKASPSPSPTPAVNCAGSWSSWSTCSGGTQSRTYTITTQPTSDGTACPSSPQSQSCTNCAGSWSSWSTCSGGTQSRTYTITTQPTSDGTACPSSPQSQSCTPIQDPVSTTTGSSTSSTTMSLSTTSSSPTTSTKASLSTTLFVSTTTLSPVTTATSTALLKTSKQVVDWDYMVPQGVTWFNVTEMPLVHCEIGQTVEISWTNTIIQHDVYELYSYPTYVDCNFASSTAVKRQNIGTSGNFTFTCETMGTRFFSCSVGNACSKGKQRIRIHGIDTRKTIALSNAGQFTLAGYMKQSVTVYKGGNTAIPETQANALEKMLISIASNSPESCSDWLIPSHLSNITCLGYVYTDLGVLYRQRELVDLDKSKLYYDIALKMIPNFCLAESYLVELQIKKNDKSAADEHFKIACKACGESDLDIEIVRMAYEEKGWALPSPSVCNPSKSIIPKDDSNKQKYNDTEGKVSLGFDLYKDSGQFSVQAFRLSYIIIVTLIFVL